MPSLAVLRTTCTYECRLGLGQHAVHRLQPDSRRNLPDLPPSRLNWLEFYGSSSDGQSNNHDDEDDWSRPGSACI